MIYIIKNKHLNVSVNSAGGSLTSIKYKNEERLWQGGEFWQSQDVVIFPIIGHAGPYTVDGETFTPKSHGVARYSEFSLADIKEDRVTLELNSNSVTKQTYPFDFTLKITYALKKNTLKITYEVYAKEGEIPFYIGGHPGMIVPDGEGIVEFEKEENATAYPVDGGEERYLEGLNTFAVNKEFFQKCKTFQLGSLSGGAIRLYTSDGFRYSYKSDCTVFAFWSNPEGGNFVCVEPWWGINDSPDAPKEIYDKPFINIADTKGSEFSYTLTIDKPI